MRIGVFLILGFMIAGNFFVWRWMRGRVRQRRWLALALLLFQLPLVGQIVWMFVWPSTAIRQHEWLPTPLIAMGYFWNLIVVPVTLIAVGVFALVKRVRPARETETDPGRRRFLSVAAGLAPPVAAAVGIAVGFPRVNDFRIRRLRVPVQGLPERLEGATIAHVSDVHYGKFTTPAEIDAVVAAVNGLDADLVLMTGDLIDLSLADLDAALAMVARLESRSGLFTCEGNHDLIDDAETFRRRAKEVPGMHLLVDERAIVKVRGAPVEILGVAWRGGEERRGRATRAQVAQRNPEAFPILLSHHPHGFDYAGDVPLTLSGHTHGGLLMLNEKLGAGPVLYRYWSGLYRKHGRALVVSNGVGTWFPVRAHAPAEIVHMTLGRAV